MSRAENTELVDNFIQFYKRYLKDEIGEFAQKYPNEQRSLYIDWKEDLQRYDADLADDFLTQPEQLQMYAEEAIRLYDYPIDINPADAHARITNLPDRHTYGVGEVGDPDIAAESSYVGVKGNISRATAYKSKIEEAAFECQRCGSLTYIPQENGDFQEPHECQACERQGPFQINFEQSEFIGYRKLQIKEPPGDAANGTGRKITAHLTDDLAKVGGVHELENRVGEEVVVYGYLGLEQAGSKNDKSAVFDPYLEAQAIDFDSEMGDIDPDEHRDEFEPLATGAAPYESFKDCIAPELKRVDNWPLAFDLAAAWLFSAPRIDPAEGSTHRGDIHWGIFGPPGVGKSIFMSALADLSPGCEHRSATGLSSDVGLVAAAVRDDFSEGDTWTLKPGILARADCHVILDEVDKADLNLSKTNDALEGRQIATVDKADIHAELKTRVGLMFAGNPDGGRWEDLEHVAVKEQIDIEDSLWSRFDGVVILQDDPDEETDREVADHMLKQHRADEARVLKSTGREIPGHVKDEFIRPPDEIQRPISKDAARAWVMAGRELSPVLTDAVEDQLRESFVDLRNPDTDVGDGFAATKRKLKAAIRLSKAFARVRLSAVVEPCDAEKAEQLLKDINAQFFHPAAGFDGESGVRRLRRRCRRTGLRTKGGY